MLACFHENVKRYFNLAYTRDRSRYQSTEKPKAIGTDDLFSNIFYCQITPLDKSPNNLNIYCKKCQQQNIGVRLKHKTSFFFKYFILPTIPKVVCPKFEHPVQNLFVLS